LTEYAIIETEKKGEEVLDNKNKIWYNKDRKIGKERGKST